MKKQNNNHANRANREYWSCCLKDKIPVSKTLRSAWTLNVKRNRFTGDIIKPKARFCADGRSQELGANYHETCARVAKWNTIRTYLTIAIMHS